MPQISALLGEKLIRNNGEEVTCDTFSGPGKVVGLYFSAHWCPPCRGFTPELCQFYENYKKTEKGTSLEMVFISSDRDETIFKEYFEEMPFLALPFVDRERKANLSRKYKVQGIPTLVFLDGENGKLITDDGRSHVNEDPEGKDFPWRPKPVSELLKGKLKKGIDGETDDSALEGKYKGLYFSAHWCPPCRTFTPELVNCYNKIVEAGHDFEMVFVSSDRADASFNEYYATMPWLAIPYGDPRKDSLASTFAVSGIPSVVILDKNDELITASGRAMVMKDPEGKDFPWYPKPLEELNNFTGPMLNESTCLVYFTEGEEAEVQKAKELLEGIAKQYQQEQKQSQNEDDELPTLCFMYEGVDSDDVVDSVRNFTLLDDRNPLVAILDIPGQQIYELHEKESITTETVTKLVNDFKTNTLTWKPLR